MEYIPHGDLQQYLGSPLPEQEGQQIVGQILEGLSFMHESNFAHRDLKPAVSLPTVRQLNGNADVMSIEHSGGR